MNRIRGCPICPISEAGSDLDRRRADGFLLGDFPQGIDDLALSQNDDREDFGGVFFRPLQVPGEMIEEDRLDVIFVGRCFPLRLFELAGGAERRQDHPQQNRRKESPEAGLSADVSRPAAVGGHQNEYPTISRNERCGWR